MKVSRLVFCKANTRDSDAQLFVILRYVDAVGIIPERFIGSFDVPPGRDAAPVFNVVDLEIAGYDYR